MLRALQTAFILSSTRFYALTVTDHLFGSSSKNIVLIGWLTMSEFVEGEWKDFEFRMVTEDDYPQIAANMRSVFQKDEPILKATGVTEDMALDFDTFLKYILSRNDNISFCAFDKKTGQIAGIRITYKVAQDDPKEAPFEVKAQKTRDIFQNVLGLSETVNLFELYGIDHFADLLFTSVNPEHRGQGLVSEIYRRSFALLRAKGYPLCKSTFTSPITQKLGVKFGFKEHARLKLGNFKDSNGSLILPNARADEQIVLMALKLQE